MFIQVELNYVKGHLLYFMLGFQETYCILNLLNAVIK